MWRRSRLQGAVIAILIFGVVLAWQGQVELSFFILCLIILALVALWPEHKNFPLVPVPDKSSQKNKGHSPTWLSYNPEPSIIVDRKGLVVQVNKPALHLLSGLKKGEALSFGLRSPDVLNALDQASKTEQPVKVNYETRFPVERSFEVLIAPLNDQKGACLFFRELTESRRLEAMRADFVANASHELKTPLASLIGFIDTLQGSAKNDPKAQERFLTIMRQQAERMTRLINDLLSLSHIELKEHVEPHERIEFAGLVTYIVDSLKPLATERNVTLHWTPATEILVKGDRDDLLRLIENLIENAIKYGESGQKVEVSLGAQDLNIEFCVKDYGCGIAREHIPRLTERFYRVDQTASREKGGTGLGLSLVKHIVNRHKGKMQIESESGSGTKVKIILPKWQS